MELLALLIIGVVLWYFFGRRPKKIDVSILPVQFIVFDLETTGLRADSHEIIEIGAVRVNRDSKHHETFQVLIKPNKKVPKKITQITGISQEMVDRDGVGLEQAISEFQTFVGDLRLVCYNAEFDMAFLHHAAAKCGKKITNPVSCALLMARKAWPRRKSYRLTDIAKVGGFSTSGAHRALKDCELTITVYGAAATTLGRIE